MNIEDIRAYCIAKKGVSEHFPFDDTTLVFKVIGKMFALSNLQSLPKRISLKCEPEYAIELRNEYPNSIQGAYYMNKKHWNMINYEEVSVSLIKELIDASYDLVCSKFTKKQKNQLKDL